MLRMFMVNNTAKMRALHVSSNQRECISYTYEDISQNSGTTNSLHAVACHTCEKIQRHPCYKKILAACDNLGWGLEFQSKVTPYFFIW